MATFGADQGGLCPLEHWVGGSGGLLEGSVGRSIQNTYVASLPSAAEPIGPSALLLDVTTPLPIAHSPLIPQVLPWPETTARGGTPAFRGVSLPVQPSSDSPLQDSVPVDSPARHLWPGMAHDVSLAGVGTHQKSSDFRDFWNTFNVWDNVLRARAASPLDNSLENWLPPDQASIGAYSPLTLPDTAPTSGQVSTRTTPLCSSSQATANSPKHSSQAGPYRCSTCGLVCSKRSQLS